MSASLRSGIGWLCVLLFPIALNGAVVSGIVVSDPLVTYSGLGVGTSPGPAPGMAHIDPSIGSSFQPLGKRSADELLNGELPWWDDDEGIGVPLAGGMISASFYPLTLLQELPNGQTVIDIVVEILSGIFTLLLLRRLCLGLFPSVLGSLLFECNGTFAWLSAGWCYPLPFLPLLLYGIELALGATTRVRSIGTAIVAAAVAVSISAAMIEIAFLDGLLCVAWAIVRIMEAPKDFRVVGFARLVVGGVAGICVATPLLVAFADYLYVSPVGPHSGVNGFDHLTKLVVPQTFLPYIWGPIFYLGDAAVSPVWGSVGGYAGTALAFFAVCGLFGAHRRSLRILLGGWIAITYAATIGIPAAQQLVVWIPGVKYIAYYRYFDASREFALALLCAFFIYDVRAGSTRDRIPYVVATVGVLAVFLQGLVDAKPLVDVLVALPAFAVYFWTSIVIGAATIVAIWVAYATLSSRAFFPYVLGGLVILEAASNAFVPTLSGPASGKINEGPVRFLRAHLGLDRFYQLGPILPSVGSYFDLAELNYIGFIAGTWTGYVTEKLDRYADPRGFDGLPTGVPNVPGPDQVVRTNVLAFENVGVKYVVSVAGSNPLVGVSSDASPTEVDARNARRVYHDETVDIDELPNPVPYFSAAGCRLSIADRKHVSTSCLRPSSLIRHELYLPGWTATTNGSRADVRASEVFQTLALPAGNCTIVFDFTPPGMPYGYAAFAFGLSIVAYQLFLAARVSKVEGAL